MKIYTHISKGLHHPVFGEDFIYHHTLDDNILVCAVMDGCSSGQDSHFVSALYGKSIHKSCRMIPHMSEIQEDFDINTMSLEEIGSFILNQLFEDIKKTKKLFFLEMEEILSTLVLMVCDSKKKTAWINVSGDGLFVVNGEVTDIDQNNMPDFMGYHLEESFELCYQSSTKGWFFSDIHDVSISTDGISKFYKKPATQVKDIDPLDFLLIQKPKESSDNFLNHQYNNLIKEGFIPADDIGIIRVIT